MISSITAYLEELKDAFVPTVAKAEEDVEEDATEEGKHLVHHYLECAERVAKAQEQPGYEDLPYKEDCVEEFFHLQHYLDECAAPRLFDKLK
ncbi:ubiquinol--cytochrome-c reductase subunit 6 [Kluyveromyces marxianus]|nr:ubiquinol--cytochrome-c reductase subunit 6 [Kluyveromyces marxianus]